MGTIRKTVTFTEKQDAWIKAQVEKGEFTNDSEYLRDLVRKDQAENEEFLAIKKAIQEGLESGVSDETVMSIWERAKKRHGH